MWWQLHRLRKQPRWLRRWRFHDEVRTSPASGERESCVSATPTEFTTGSGGEERARRVAKLRLLWGNRKLVFRAVMAGALVSAGLVMLIPVRYEATAQLMPPDGQSGTGMAMLSALAGRAGGFGGIASDLLGVRNSGALFVGILGSRTVQDRLIEQFELGKIYHASKMEDARKVLASQTRVTRRAATRGETGFGRRRKRIQRICEQEHGDRHPRAGQGHRGSRSDPARAAHRGGIGAARTGDHVHGAECAGAGATCACGRASFAAREAWRRRHVLCGVEER